MTIEQLIKKYQIVRESINDAMILSEENSIDHEIYFQKWLVYNNLITDLVLIKSKNDSKFTFEQFENHFKETVKMFEDNAKVNIDNCDNFNARMYGEGYLQAIDSIIKSFNYSAKSHLMRKEEV